MQLHPHPDGPRVQEAHLGLPRAFTEWECHPPNLKPGLSNRYRNVVPLPNGTSRTTDGVSGPHAVAPCSAENGTAWEASIRHLNGSARASWSSSAEAPIVPESSQSPLLTAPAHPAPPRASSKDEWQMAAQDGKSQHEQESFTTKASASEGPISAMRSDNVQFPLTQRSPKSVKLSAAQAEADSAEQKALGLRIVARGLLFDLP